MAPDEKRDSTVGAEVCAFESSLSFLELHGQGVYGLKRIPLLRPTVELRLETAGEFPPLWTVDLHRGRAIFRPACGTMEAHEVALESWLLLGEERWAVVDIRGLPPYRLTSLSPTMQSRGWPLGDGQWTMGRPGRRYNNIILDSPSVSRAHARLDVQSGRAFVLAEAEGATTAVNGSKVEAGQSRLLEHNDLLQIGDLLFRWEHNQGRPPADKGLVLGMLGGASVAVSSHPEVGLAFRNEKARDLLLWLVACRGRPLALERVLEEFWPERPDFRQRKNLSHTLRSLEPELGWSRADYDRWLDRKGEWVSLKPEAVAKCDLWDLQDALRRALAPADIPALVALHRGPLLPNARSLWVQAMREELFLGWLSLARRVPVDKKSAWLLGDTLTTCLRDGGFDESLYSEVFEVAAKHGLTGLVRVWVAELEAHLRLSGDAPSQALRDQAARIGLRSERLD